MQFQVQKCSRIYYSWMFIIFFYKRSSNYWMRSLISWIHLMNVFLESSVFANIRPSNVQKEFSFFAFFCVFSSLMMDCRNFVRSSVIKMLSLLFLRFFFFIKIEFFTSQLRKRHINWPLPLFIGPILWERLISFSVRGCARPSLSFTMLTICLL